MKYQHLLVAALALASFASGAMRIVPDFDPATPACPTINPPGAVRFESDASDCDDNGMRAPVHQARSQRERGAMEMVWGGSLGCQPA